MIVEGQVAGGVAQGAGAVLMEEIRYGSEGELRSGTFLDYLIPTASEVPSVEVTHLVTPSTVHELGTKGVGEGGTIGATAAPAHAIADALSLTDVKLPLTPDRLISLIRCRNLTTRSAISSGTHCGVHTPQPCGTAARSSSRSCSYVCGNSSGPSPAKA